MLSLTFLAHVIRLLSTILLQLQFHLSVCPPVSHTYAPCLNYCRYHNIVCTLHHDILSHLRILSPKFHHSLVRSLPQTNALNMGSEILTNNSVISCLSCDIAVLIVINTVL